MSTRIDPERDLIIEQHPDELPDALRESRRPKTHAYPAGQVMDMGSVKLFGPKKAPQPLRQLVIQRRDDVQAVAPPVQVAKQEPVIEPEVKSWAEVDEEEDATVQRMALLEL